MALFFSVTVMWRWVDSDIGGFPERIGFGKKILCPRDGTMATIGGEGKKW
jgi:hypothetical protein